MPFSIKNFIAAFIFLFVASPVFADEAASRKLRQLIEVTPKERLELNRLRNTTKLRTTRGFDQGASQLCWYFSTMNMLETNYLEAHPEVSKLEVELSRWYGGKLAGSIFVRGTSIDALNFYIRKSGIVMNTDYPKYGPDLPERTTFLGEAFTPLALFEAFNQGVIYWSYGFSDAISGWAPHPDPDALRGTTSYFSKPSRMANVIVESITTNRKSVTYTEGGHIVQIYGVTFEEQGKPKFYHIKDSYSPFFYDAAASRVHQNGIEVTALGGLNHRDGTAQ